MGLYQHVRELYKKPKDSLGEVYRQRLIQWRKGDVIVKIDRPTRIDRARSLGYRAKEGIFVARVRVNRSRRLRRGSLKHKRKSKHMRSRKIVAKSYQVIAEQRADKKFVNAEVLNSYWVAEDGKNKWYEIIMVIPSHPAIQADPTLNWICEPQHRGRVWRGLTTAGKRSRGILTHKGKGAEKLRPSLRAHNRLSK
ncbi:MAG: 50S ribosomal protein L15e [Candidatus Woesearchaeota archaeon]|nr:MAG: 50S ribosomal protein L15e [Candidatus Woesearchaeota archaeon]